MSKWIFQKRSQPAYSIQKVPCVQSKENSIATLRQAIKLLDQQITEEVRELIKTQTVGVKASLSSHQNWFYRFQKKMYWPAIQEATSWHQNEILVLQRQRRKLEIELDLLTGQVWPKRIKRSIIYTTAIISSIIALWIMLMGIVAALYLIPLWASILVLYLLLKNRIRFWR